jgi:hypothetical protein
MLKDYLAHNIDLYEAEVRKYIMNYRNKEITGTIFYTYKEYENYMQIYRTSKSNYKDVLEAFVSLWVSTLIDEEEWHEHFEPTFDFADSIYNNWFKKEISQYTFHNAITETLIEYIISKAIRMKELVQDYRNNNPLTHHNLTYPSPIPGIYINRDMIDEQKYIFQISKNPIEAVELNSNNEWAGYKEIFIETEEEYLYFRE